MFHLALSVLPLLTELCDFGVADIPCPAGRIAGNTSCYLFGHYETSFAGAQQFCRMHSSVLVELNSRQENDFIKEELRFMKAERWWMGISDKKVKGEWRWVTQGALTSFTNWGPSEPQQQDGEDCAMFLADYNFAWADVNCAGDDIVPVCEKRASWP